MRGRTAASALVEQDDAIALRVVQTAHGRCDAAAGAAMDHDDRLAVRVAALLDMDSMQRRNLKHLFLERLDFWIKRIARHEMPFWFPSIRLVGPLLCYFRHQPNIQCGQMAAMRIVKTG